MSKLIPRDSALTALKRYLAKHQNTPPKNEEDTVINLDLLNEQWRKFTEAQDAVEESCGTSTLSIEMELRIQGEEYYIKARSILNRLLTSFRPSSTPSSRASTLVNEVADIVPKVTLPKFDLPRFTGDATTWMTFSDSFTSIINKNEMLTGSQKLHYLRCSLSGEPLQLISNFNLQDANYTEAWNLLKARYNVKRIIIDQHFAAIFSVKIACADSAAGIKSVIDPIFQHIRALKSMEMPIHHWDDWLIHVIVHKLAYETRRNWELSITKDAMPTLAELQQFLEARCRSLDVLGSPVKKIAIGKASTAPKAGSALCHAAQSKRVGNVACSLCNDSHKLYSCPEFLNMSAELQLETVQQLKACINCLGPRHNVDNCKSQITCRECHAKHHSLLHAALGLSTEFESSQMVAATHHTGENTGSKNNAAVLLATALLDVKDSFGKNHVLRALLDNGSHTSFITEACVLKLNLPRKRKATTITSIGGRHVCSVNKEATLSFMARNGKQIVTISALVLPKVTGELPPSPLNISSWPHLEDLPLADPTYNLPAKVDLLIGADELPVILKP